MQNKIKAILFCLAIGWAITAVGIGSSVGLVIILALAGRGCCGC